MSWVEAFYSALIDLPEPLTEGIYLQISLNHIQNACIVYSLKVYSTAEAFDKVSVVGVLK